MLENFIYAKDKYAFKKELEEYKDQNSYAVFDFYVEKFDIFSCNLIAFVLAQSVIQ